MSALRVAFWSKSFRPTAEGELFDSTSGKRSRIASTPASMPSPGAGEKQTTFMSTPLSACRPRLAAARDPRVAQRTIRALNRCAAALRLQEQRRTRASTLFTYQPPNTAAGRCENFNVGYRPRPVFPRGCPARGQSRIRARSILRFSRSYDGAIGRASLWMPCSNASIYSLTLY